MIRKNCANCAEIFTVTDLDLEFYSKIHVLQPTYCPACRLCRRLATRNERSLYKRPCDLCHKPVISIFNETVKFPVYCRACFWSDNWDALHFGRNFDFSRPFFEQYQQLQETVPRLAIFTNKSENCDYTCHSFGNRNCYLSFGIKNCEDVYYSSKGFNLKNCIDILNCYDSELCHECMDCEGCYGCKRLIDCKNCCDCELGFDLIGCNNCFGCVSLRQKQFCIFNEQKIKEDYFKELKSLLEASPRQIKERFRALEMTHPHKFAHQLNNENCTGEYIYNSKRSEMCFDVRNLEDCAYCVFAFDDKNCYDIYGVGFSELAHECMGVEEVNNIAFCYATDNTSQSYYCALCFNSSDLFGCIGLKRKNFCILNKQYSKEAFGKLRLTIIEHMQKTGEWGEFFSIAISPYAYNETVAMEIYPLTKEKALKKGYKWHEEADDKTAREQTCAIPAKIAETPDSIVNEILCCKECGKAYRIIAQELKLYRQMNINAPKICQNCRYKRRLLLRNPAKLWSRQCQRCGGEILTTYSPDRPEKIYCEGCYQGEVY